MSSTLKVIVAVMISGTFGFMGSYFFTHRSLTTKLAEAVSARAIADDDLAKTRFELGGVREKLQSVDDVERNCARALDRANNDLAENNKLLADQRRGRSQCEADLKERSARLAVLDGTPPADSSSKLSSTTTPGFRGVPWGSNIKYTVDHEKNDLVEGTHDYLIYNGEIGGMSVAFMYLFTDQTLVRGAYVSTEKHTNDNLHISDYETFKKLLTAKYGKPARDNTTWLNDLYQGDTSHYGMAIAVGHLMYSAEWRTHDTQIILELTGDNYDTNLSIKYLSTLLNHKYDTKLLARALERL